MVKNIIIAPLDAIDKDGWDKFQDFLYFLWDYLEKKKTFNKGQLIILKRLFYK